MVTLDQIRSLEAKVQRTVAYIADLKEENALLQKNLEKYRQRIDELEVLINSYKEDQNEIEQGIINALSHLDRLEDEISRSSPPVPTPETPDSPAEVNDLEARPVLPRQEESPEAPAGDQPAGDDYSPIGDYVGSGGDSPGDAPTEGDGTVPEKSSVESELDIF